MQLESRIKIQGLVSSELPAFFQGKRLLQPVSYFENKRNATGVSEHYLHAVVEKLWCSAWFCLLETLLHITLFLLLYQGKSASRLREVQ